VLEGRSGLRIAYLNYGEQSGVTAHVAAALEALGHRVIPVFGRGPLELRDPVTRRPRVTPRVLAALAAAVARFGSQALAYRWNTPFAFDTHSRWAGELLDGLPLRPDVVLQNGALFSPGSPPRLPYVVLLDHTRALAERSPAHAEAGVGAPPPWGAAWLAREAATYRGAAALATFSERAARSVVADYGADPARVRVVGAGANVVPPEPVHDDDGETVLFIGRDFERKGGHVLLDAFARLRRARPRARLLVAGPVRPLSLPEGAFQLGLVPLERIPDLFRQASVFALPTLHEPFGIAYLDAMACGVACVGTRVEAVPEIVEDGATGLLVPPGDPVALAGALRALLADRVRAREMGARGRERALAQFTWAHVAARLEPLLAAAASGAVQVAKAEPAPARRLEADPREA
jgi:alpha-maltose-1-phosphate synthase